MGMPIVCPIVKEQKKEIREDTIFQEITIGEFARIGNPHICQEPQVA